MKWLIMLPLLFSLVGCINKQEEETDKQRKEKTDNMYKTPPPSDRSKDKGY
jgi:hypothetical protein